MSNDKFIIEDIMFSKREQIKINWWIAEKHFKLAFKALRDIIAVIKC